MEGRDVFLFWRPAGFVCGPFKSVESSSPSCVAQIACIFVPVSSLGLALGQHLPFTTGEQNYSIFFPSWGTNHWDAFVKSVPHGARCSGFWRWFFLCFSVEVSSAQTVRWELLGRRSSLKCLRLAWCLLFPDTRFLGDFPCGLLVCLVACGSPISSFFYTNKNFIVAKLILFSDLILSTDTLRTLKFGPKLDILNCYSNTYLWNPSSFS